MEDINVDINQNPTDKTKILYNAVSKDYNVGSFDEFSKKLQDPSKREAFYKGVGSEYNLGSYDEFSKKVGAVEKKNLGGTISPTELPASSPSQLPKSSTGRLIVTPLAYADDGQKAAVVQPTTITEKLFGNVRPEKQQLDVIPKVRNVEKEIEAEQVGKKITSDAIKNTLKAYKDRLSGDGTYNISDTDPALINQKNDLEKDLKEGNLQVVKSKKTGQYILARKNDSIDSISQAYNNVKDKQAEDRFVANLSTIDKIRHYENKKALVKDEYLPSEPSGFGGAFGTLIGENITPLAELAAATTVVGKYGKYVGLAGDALASAKKFTSFLTFATDAGYSGYANNTEKVYNALRAQNPNGDKVSQMQHAERAGLVGEVSGLAGAGAMTGAFARLNTAAKNVNVQPLVSSLEQLAHHTVKESATQGAFAAGGSILSDLGAISQGVKMKPSEIAAGAAESAKGIAEFTAVMGSAMGIAAGFANVPKYVKAQATGILAKLNPVLVNDAYKEAEASGAAPIGTAEKAMQQINGFKEAQKKVPTDLPDENVNAIAGIQQKIDKLEAQKKTLAPQFHDRIDAVIDSLRSRSKEIASSDKPLEKEVDDITQQPTNVRIEPAIAEEVTPVVEEVKPKINGEDVVKKWVAGIPDTRFTDEERKAFNTVPMKRITELRIEFHKNIENTAKELDAIEKEKKDAYYNILKDNELKNAQELSEVYHRSKEKGSNPELVKAVEDLLGKAAKVEEVKPTEVKEKVNIVKLTDLPDRAFAVGMTVEKFEDLKSKIQKEGFTQPIIIDKESGNVLDGQSRLLVAQDLGIKDVPSIYMDNPTRSDLNEKIKELEKQYIPSQEVKPTEVKGSVGVGGDVVEMPISKFTDTQSDFLTNAIERVKSGKKSRTEGLPEVEIRDNGLVSIVGGNHRIAQAILNGDKTVKVKVLNPKTVEQSLKETTKEEVKPTKTREFFHGGRMDSEGDIFLTPDERIAKEYASNNEGKVHSFSLDENKIIQENEVRSIIKELGIKGNTDYLLHELLDPRFDDTALNKSDIDKIKLEIKKRGYDAISYTDEDITGKSKGGVESIMVLNKESLNKPTAKATEVKETVKLLENKIKENPSAFDKIKDKISKFSLNDIKEFFHASESKRIGRLRKGEAAQFGEGIYFSTDKDTVKDNFGKEVTNVLLNIENPVFTNTKEWNKVEDLALKMANEGKRIDEDGYIEGGETDIAEIKPKFISNAAKELGYDAIIDKNSQHGNEISVIDDSKIIYEEDLPKAIAESYHKAKIDGNNPELVKSVEEQLKPKENAIQEPSTSSVLQYPQEGARETRGERGRVEPSKQGEAIAEKVKQVEGNEEEVKPKEYTSKTGRQKIVYDEKGNSKVIDTKTGKEVSRETAKKVFNEAADNYDFSKGKKASFEGIGEGDLKNEKEGDNYVIDNSSNPTEIAEIYARQELEPPVLNSAENAIVNHGIGKIDVESFKRFNDKNNITFGLAKNWFQKGGKGSKLDAIAEEISAKTGVNVTPEDIGNFMVRFPSGAKAEKLSENQTAYNARNKFEKLTGLPLTEEIAHKAIDYEFNKLTKEQQAIAEQDFKTRKQLEDAYWAEQPGAVKPAPEKGDNIATKQARKAEKGLKEPIVEKKPLEGIQKEYQEVINKTGERVREKAKLEFVERNFDSILDKLKEKIKEKCPT